MSRTRKNHAALYIAFLITGIVLSVAMPSARAQKPSRGKHNGKIVFISDRNYKGLSVWSMNPDGSSPTRLTDDTSRAKKLPDFSPSTTAIQSGRRMAQRSHSLAIGIITSRSM